MKSWVNKLFARELSADVQARLSQGLASVVDPISGQLLALWLVDARQGLLGVSLVFEVPYAATSLWAGWQTQIKAACVSEGLTVTDVDFVTRIMPRQTQAAIEPIKGVTNVLAVASGKGGVGKSTTAANLALALTAEGAKVGILDADIYGPSMPTLFGLTGQMPHSSDGKTMEPLEAYGVKVNSIGFLVEADSPMIWRGPVVTGSLMQLINETNWGSLDFLIVDLPPGTGDTQLTLAQKIAVSGSVIVTTPQDLAMLDARKGLKMFEKVNIPVLGIVENMAMHVCSACGHVEHIFGQGGGAKMSADFNVPLLASLPLDMRIREQADGGKPTVVAEPTGAIALAYRALAHQVGAALANRPQSFANKFGKIEVKSA
jgi:ATP-binding protein involved in chromosome partitioning